LKLSFRHIVFLIFVLSLTVQIVDAQEVIEKPKRNCIVSVWPSNVERTNGIMLNFWSKEFSKEDLAKGNISFPTTNGLELNLNPIGLFVFPMVLTYFILDSKTRRPMKDSIDYQYIDLYKKINGVQIALLNSEPTIMNGIEVHLSGSYGSIANGISISLIAGKRDKLNGLGIGVIGNFDTEVNGAQIGLFNNTKKLKGIQIGLWNTNQKRSLPFINWNF